jgi:hypothetical protein
VDYYFQLAGTSRPFPLHILIFCPYLFDTASPPVLQAFRLLGALPLRIVHSLFRPVSSQPQSPDPSKSISSPSPSRWRRHPVLVLRPLLVSRDPTERWAALACLGALDVRLWAGVPLEGEDKRGDGNDSTNLIPPVLDEWEVGAIMRGLSDPDQTIRKLVRSACFRSPCHG